MNANTDMEQQFMKAYDELSDAIFRHCYFRIGDRERAKDLMQDTFTKSWQYINQGTQVSNLRAFLYKVANNLIIDEYRKKKELSLDTMMTDGFDPGFDDRKKNEQDIDSRFVLNIINKMEEHNLDKFINIAKNIKLVEEEKSAVRYSLLNFIASNSVRKIPFGRL